LSQHLKSKSVKNLDATTEQSRDVNLHKIKCMNSEYFKVGKGN